MLNKILFALLAGLAGIGVEHILVASDMMNVSIPYSSQPPEDYSLAPKRR
jgi:hypothetical protein